jgi:hypothetical protein
MDAGLPAIAPLVLLLLRSTKEGLRLLVHPELHAIVLPEDFEFVKSLLRDFGLRTQLHPADLFKHLSSLEHGPLITQHVGADLSDFPHIEKQCAQFVPI